MIVVYRPDGQDEATRYEFRPGRIRSGDASTILRHYKRLSGNPQATWEGFKGVACPSGDPEAKRLMLWFCQRPDHPKLRIDDVDPMDDEVEIELDRGELLDLRAQILVAKGMGEGQRELIIDRIDMDLAAFDRPDGPVEDVPDAGKDPGSTSTSSSTEPSTDTTQI